MAGRSRAASTAGAGSQAPPGSAGGSSAGHPTVNTAVSGRVSRPATHPGGAGGAASGGLDESPDHTFMTGIGVAEPERPSTAEANKYGGASFATNILVYLDAKRVRLLQREFTRRAGGLALHEFVLVMKSFLTSAMREQDLDTDLNTLTETQLVSNLCELFAQIDVNGDGSMEWDEFTSFVVEMGMHGTEGSHNPSEIQMYHPSMHVDDTKHGTPITFLQYFPELDRIALSEHNGNSLKLYTRDVKIEKAATRADGAVHCAEHIPSLSSIVVASSDLQMTFYDDATLRLQKTFHAPSSQLCLRWAPEVQTLFSAGVSGVVHAWDADFMEEKYTMGGVGRDGSLMKGSHTDIVLDLLHIPSLETLATASMDRSIRLWDMYTGKLRKTLEGHAKGVRSLAYSPDYRFMVSAGFDYDALVWNPYVEKVILPLHGHTASLVGVEIVPGTPQIVTADVEGVFRVWDIRNFACVQTFNLGDGDEPASFASVDRHKNLLLGGRKLHIFDYEKLENPKLADDHTVFTALFNPTSNTFITASVGSIKIWDAHTGSLSRVYRHLMDGDMTSLTLDDRERKFVVGDSNGVIKVFDYLNGAEMKRMHQFDGEVSDMIYCPRDKCVMASSRDRSLAVVDEMDPEKGVLLKHIANAHSHDITAMAYSERLTLVASGGSDGTLRVWGFEFGKVYGLCLGHTSAITALAFAEPYPLLIAADAAGGVSVWGVYPGPIRNQCIFRFFPNQIGRAAPSPSGGRKSRSGTDTSDGGSGGDRGGDDAHAGAASAASAAGSADDGGDGAAGDDAGDGGDAGEAGGSAEDPSAMSDDPAIRMMHLLASPVLCIRTAFTWRTVPRSRADGAATPLNGTPRNYAHANAAKHGKEVDTYELYMADEKGRVTAWDMIDTMRELEEMGFNPLFGDVLCPFPRRNVAVDATTPVLAVEAMLDMEPYERAVAARTSFYFAPGFPLIATPPLVRRAAWLGHTDAVVSLELIEEPPALVTSSFDRRVKVWSRTGQLLGSLKQGGQQRAEHARSKWGFEVDNGARIKRMQEFAEQTMETVNREMGATEVARLEHVLDSPTKKSRGTDRGGGSAGGPGSRAGTAPGAAGGGGDGGDGRRHHHKHRHHDHHHHHHHGHEGGHGHHHHKHKHHRSHRHRHSDSGDRGPVTSAGGGGAVSPIQVPARPAGSRSHRAEGGPRRASRVLLEPVPADMEGQVSRERAQTAGRASGTPSKAAAAAGVAAAGPMEGPRKPSTASTVGMPPPPPHDDYADAVVSRRVPLQWDDEGGEDGAGGGMDSGSAGAPARAATAGASTRRPPRGPPSGKGVRRRGRGGRGRGAGAGRRGKRKGSKDFLQVSHLVKSLLDTKTEDDVDEFGLSAADSQPAKPFRTVPNLIPIDASNAGRPRNATIAGYNTRLGRSSEAPAGSGGRLGVAKGSLPRVPLTAR